MKLLGLHVDKGHVHHEDVVAFRTSRYGTSAVLEGGEEVDLGTSNWVELEIKEVDR